MKWLQNDIPVGTALIEAVGGIRGVKEIASLLLNEDGSTDAASAREAGLHMGLLGLRASACTVVAASLAREATKRGEGPVVYVTADHSSLEDAREDMAFLLGAEQVVHFPDLGVLPYGNQIPGAPTRARRIEALSQLVASREGDGAPKRPQVVLTTPAALFQRIPHPRHFSRFVRQLRVGQRLELDELLELLVRLGYQGETMVGEYGDFSRRGGIVDIYSYGRENPVRVEFDDDEIVSLREFDVFNQRSVRVLSTTSILPLWEAIVDEQDWVKSEASGFIPSSGPLRDHLEMLRTEGNFEGIEWMLQGLGVPLGTLLDFAGDGALVVAEDPVLLENRLEEARQQVRESTPEGRQQSGLGTQGSIALGSFDFPDSAEGEDAANERVVDREECGLDPENGALVSEDHAIDPEEDPEVLAPLFSPPEALFVMAGNIGDLFATHRTVYMGIGAGSQRTAADGPREPRQKRKGWTAGDQLASPDPLEENSKHRQRSPEWRAMLARKIRSKDQTTQGKCRAHESDHRGTNAKSLESDRHGMAADPLESARHGMAADSLESHSRETDADLIEAEMAWGDHAETSSLMTYTSRHFTVTTRPQEHFGRNLDLVRDYIKRLRRRGLSVSVLCDTVHHRDRLEELMEGVGADFVVGNLAGGFELPDLRMAVLTDHEIFERIRRRRAGRRFSRGISLKEMLAMRPGDYVVHIDHGIGAYRGVERLIVNGHLTDCMKIEYAGGDKLFIPVDQLSLVQKYAAEEGARPSLSKLGSGKWAKTKARVKKSIKEMADELISLYALRKSRAGHAFSTDTVWQTEMEACFAYEETPDQLSAIDEVKGDMERAVPMDRLICGDVGYGKTEVAIRAAFKTVMDGMQVGVLVPTTLLAQQHFDTFSERLNGYPVRVEMLSRFRTRKEIIAVLKDLAAGKVDVVIGTHRLLSKDVCFKNLGFVIVDEEQRFGVAHKERLKRMRTEVDVLTLTATPIPRTMNLALVGARDMSTIRTPPRDRRPVKTEIVEFGEEIISYALMREADRGGQSFFVHNRVESIDAMANYIRQLVPHLRVVVAHGQMRERHLEDVMSKFLAGEYDVLVSTVIIESGLDLPNVNTIIVNRTDTFGLAQLYQLRGRVGRSARKAYAYLLIPPNRVMTETAMKRLKAIEEFEDLGSGFQLAMRDLEIRGAGNILGGEQHGFIVNVGYDMYNRLLKEAVQELKGQSVEEKTESRVVTDLEAYLSKTYITNDPEKMNLYKSLADAITVDEVGELAEEVADRFGRLPVQAENLFELRRLRIRASSAGVETMILRDGGVRLELGRELTREDVQRLIRQMPVPITFKTHGAHRVEAVRSVVRGEMLLVAGQILDCLMKDSAQ
ncbi:MAG: transcription-repair coupling factor [Candidatus Eisenbacteria sp.]|nr:transcription-repair coupling factor [Candidatus Eisenbacteria bacterium]